MNNMIKKEIKSLIKILKLNCSIKEFKGKVKWKEISICQKLSEDFIREFKDKVEWVWISRYQKLSEDFIREFKNKVDGKLNRKINADKSLGQKEKEIKAYAKKHGLRFDGKFLYAFRNHDFAGHGAYNKTIFYEEGNYYRDWHCDMRKTEKNSFGLGIWPKGNTPVRVAVEDWGVAVSRRDGKARVLGFTVDKS